jgi:2'-5' RNA ligase
LSNLVIVAIPDENDRVWKVSSEKVPHLTLLFLGEADQVSNLQSIIEFVEHAASTTLRRFYLPVDRRDELGEDKADTLIFKKGRYDYKAIRDFRMFLLKDDNIRKAYDAAPQHEGPWLPHLTLGYPDSPAKADDTDRDFGFYDVAFNKIAVWTDNYDGPDFLLKDYWDEWETMETAPMDVAWSDLSEEGEQFLIEHYGVKGMKWGERKDRLGSTRGGMAKREGIQKFLDPQGHNVNDDIVKAFIWPLVPPLGAFSGPAQIRLARGAVRGVQAKRTDTMEKKFAAKAHSDKNFISIHNGASAKINRELDGINKKYSDADLSKPASKKKYEDEVVKMMQGAYKESANSVTNKKNTQHLDVEFKNDGLDFKIKANAGPGTPQTERVKHAAEDEEPEFTYHAKFLRKASGRIMGLDFEEFNPDIPADDMAQAAEDGAEFLVHLGLMPIEEFLEHYGVKGMQWGVRRDGRNSATPTAVATTSTTVIPSGNRRKTKIKVEGGQNHDAHPDAIKVAEAKTKLKKSGPATLSNKELQDVAKRLQLEQQVKQLTAPAGKKFVTNLLKQQGNQTVGGVVQSEVRKKIKY